MRRTPVAHTRCFLAVSETPRFSEENFERESSVSVLFKTKTVFQTFFVLKGLQPHSTMNVHTSALTYLHFLPHFHHSWIFSWHTSKNSQIPSLFSFILSISSPTTWLRSDLSSVHARLGQDQLTVTDRLGYITHAQYSWRPPERLVGFKKVYQIKEY